MRRLVFVVNPASGGRRGAWLAEGLAARVGAADVHLLGRCDLAALAQGLMVEGVGSAPAALVACGGDGTAAAVGHALHAAGGSGAAALGIIPLGTGNDLARACGWRVGVGDDAALARILARMAVAPVRPLDRWELHGPAGMRGWFNYWSLGLDARIATRFHQLRRRHGVWFPSALANRLLYTALGLREPHRPLSCRLRAGPPLPGWASALVVASIPSYAGGARLAADMRADDGRLELFALAAGLPLGMAASGLRRPYRVASGPGIDLDLGAAMAMQLDGEPSWAPAGRYRVRPGGRIAVLVGDGGG